LYLIFRIPDKPARAMRALIFVPAAVAFQMLDQSVQLGTEADFDGLKTTLKNIAAKSNGNINSSTIAAVNTILDTVNTTLMDALEADRSHCQNILDASRNFVHRCDNIRAGWFGAGEEWPTHNTDVTNAGNDHSTCRSQEAVEFNNMTHHCDLVDKQVAQWTICDLPGDLASGDNDKIHEYVCCLETFFATNYPTYIDRRNNCIAATNVHAAKRVTCNTEQEQFESKFCSRETQVQNECKEYRECRTSAETHWLKVTAETQALEDIFQTQRVALECLLCYGSKILANETDLSECENPPTCDELKTAGKWCPTITYQDLSDFVPCTEPVGDVNIPCNSAFIANNYQAWSNEETDDFRECTEHSGLPDREPAVPPSVWGVPSTDGTIVAPSPVQDCNACPASALNTEGDKRPTPADPSTSPSSRSAK